MNFIGIDLAWSYKNNTAISARFRKYFAGAHPCNLNKFKGKVRGHELVKKLRSLGLRQNPYINISKRRQITNIIIEVYPHPAQVVLFKLRKRILYKRGDVETKRKGLLRLRKCIIERLTTIELRLNENSNLTDLCTRNMRSMRGKSLKSYEDTLDSLICSYVGLYHWYWGSEKSEVIGNMQTGYIVNPKNVKNLP